MTIKSLVSEINQINQFLNKSYPDGTRPEAIFARMVKIQEELGEFADEVLANLNFQRRDKASKYDHSSLSKEWADVLLAHLVLAVCLNLDIENIIKDRLNQIKNRYQIK